MKYISRSRKRREPKYRGQSVVAKKDRNSRFPRIRNGLDKVNLVSENDDITKLSTLRSSGGDRTAVC